MSTFETVLDQFCRKRLLVVGDIMLDRFVYGSVARISPEAPAPVINMAVTEEAIGGAGNVARNIAALGAACDLVAVVGSDDAARAIDRLLAQHPGIMAALETIPERVTTVKTRFVATLHNTHLLRADAEETAPLAEKNEDAVIAAVKSRLAKADAIVLSDYGKGVLSPRTAAAIIALARGTHAPVIVDPKGHD